MFERLMERVFAGLTFVTLLIYLDDVIVFSKTFEAHLENLSEVFQRLQEANLKLNPKKCSLFCKKVSFLGHQVSEEGVATDPEKIQTVKNWPQMQNVKEVRQFIGLASYYRKYIPGFATICKPLHRLTEKDHPFVWSDECQTAFETIKTLLTSAPILSYPLPGGQPFILDCDASNVGVGAVLHQLQDGEEKVIGYFSRCLSRAERKYCTTRKELLAVVLAIKHFHHYLYGQEFTVRSDHGSLQWLLNFRNGEGQLARFLETLSAYTFKIQFRPGRLHSNSDALSRRPCYDNNCQYCARYESRYGNALTVEQKPTTEKATAVKEIVLEDVLIDSSVSTVRIDDCEDKQHRDSAVLNVKQDNDPETYTGPIIADKNNCSSNASATTSLGQRVTSVLSQETTPRDVTVRGPSPVEYGRTNAVDVGTHKIMNSYCQPYNYCCHVADKCDDDWLDFFVDGSLSDCLFGKLENHGVEDCSEASRLNPDLLQLAHDSTTVFNISDVNVNRCENVDHAGMISTRRNTHGDSGQCSCGEEVSCRTETPNMQSVDPLQTSPSDSTSDRHHSSCKKEINIDKSFGCSQKVSTTTEVGTKTHDEQTPNQQNEVCLEITRENICIEQEKDCVLKLILQWKREGVKPSWSTVAPHCKELKVYWYQWDIIEIRDNLLCKRYERS
ncbi:MAG: reverse transcriptase, partial [Candidatus Thiodiazotropha taylori]|nr:reverse transcriptase [Candidatus Thiodiazotropha taylori]MCW4311014.1 reverse transcriptase [Candidatus Thiodiazotropha endolucinida]